MAALSVSAALIAMMATARAEGGAPDPCNRAAPGSAVPEPRDLRSDHGVLKVDLSVHDFRETDGTTRYCYVLPDGTVAPTLRLHPGDLLVLHLKNELVNTDPAQAKAHVHEHSHASTTKSADPCTSGAMTA